MFPRLVAGSLVAIWLLLLGIDFTGDEGLIENYLGSKSDQAVDSVLTGYGQVTLVSNDAAGSILPILVREPADFSSPPKYCVPIDWMKSELHFSKEDIPIYKLHLAFLI